MTNTTPTTSPLTYQQFVESRFKAGHLLPSDPLSLKLNHAILAIPAELGELIEPGADILEEAGDIMFYLQAIVNQFPAHLPHWETSLNLGRGIIYRCPGYIYVHDVLIQLAKLIDQIKQVTIYGKPAPANWGLIIVDHCISLAGMTLAYARNIDPRGFMDGKYDTFDQLMESNQAKLTKRHPVGYTDTQAIEKADHVDGKVDWADDWTATRCRKCDFAYNPIHHEVCPKCLTIPQ